MPMNFQSNLLRLPKCIVAATTILISFSQGFILHPSNPSSFSILSVSFKQHLTRSSTPFPHLPHQSSTKLFHSYSISPTTRSNSHNSHKIRGYHEDIVLDETIVERCIDNDEEDNGVKILQAIQTKVHSIPSTTKTNDSNTHACLSTNCEYHGYLFEKNVQTDIGQQRQHEALIHYDCDNVVNDNNNNNGAANDILAAIIHKLYRQHLTLTLLEQAKNNSHSYHEDVPFVIYFEYSENEELLQIDEQIISSLGLQQIIIQSTNEYKEHDHNGDNHPKQYFEIEPIQFIRHLHEYSFHHRGFSQGRAALDILGILSKRRVPFNDQNDEDKHSSSLINDSKNNNNYSNSINNENGRNVISIQRQIIPLPLVDEVVDIMKTIKSNGWLSTNPDSVDGLPSLHLNLITEGKPLFSDKTNENNDLSSFRPCVSQLSSILEPFLYDELLPLVRDRTGSSTVQISDVFLRSYGRDVQVLHSMPNAQNDEVNDNTATVQVQEEEEEEEENTFNNSRFGLSPHYDVFSSATCVIALDSTAANGTNGLYTINAAVSNHAALKNFFQLNTGDGVIHSFDILHGVDMDENLNSSRTSLIIWFIDHFGKDNDDIDDDGDDDMVVDQQPWLWDPSDDDHVKQFIYALASECKMSENEVTDDKRIHDLYLKSAMMGNAFSLNSLAEICGDGLLSIENVKIAMDISLKLSEDNPFVSMLSTNQNFDHDEDENEKFVIERNLAKALWYESSIRGHRVAQVSLADSLMEEYMSTVGDNKDEDILVMASTLFSMAAQQGYVVANDALSRVMRIEYSRLRHQCENDEDFDEDLFLSQPVVQIAILSL